MKLLITLFLPTSYHFNTAQNYKVRSVDFIALQVQQSMSSISASLFAFTFCSLSQSEAQLLFFQN
jgi:hypothetical protein